MTRSSNVLGVDVDGTVYSPWEKVNEYIEGITGEPCEEWTSYDYLRHVYGDKFANAAFAHAIHPSRIPERVLFDGVERTIKKLMLMGVQIMFITHNHDPDAMRQPLVNWLRENFGLGVGVCVLPHNESKHEVLEVCDAFGMIDDKPDFICEVADNGLFAASMVHTYNREEITAHPGVLTFGTWRDPRLVNAIYRAHSLQKVG